MNVAAFIAAAIVTAAGASLDVPTWTYMVGATGLWTLLFRVWFVRLERRQSVANARKTEAETDEITVKAAAEAVKLVRAEMAEMRVELAEARKAEAELQAQLAAAHAELAITVSRASDERSTMKNALDDAHHEISRLERRMDDMRAEMGTLRAQVDRRRRDRRADD